MKRTICFIIECLFFFVKHGMIVDKIHGIFSFTQSKWLDKYINIITQKRNKAKNEFENDFYKLLTNVLYGRTRENVRNRLGIESFKNYEYKIIIKQLSKLTFAEIHKSYEDCDRYSFKQIEVRMDKPNYLGFSVLELSKLHMYETYYDKRQPYFHILDKKGFNCTT